jgi:hypothetical protein
MRECLTSTVVLQRSDRVTVRSPSRKDGAGEYDKRAETFAMKNRALTLALAFAAGLLAGTLSRYVTPTTVFAQAQSTAPKDIRAQRFSLVDEHGTVRGIFAVENDGNATIKLFDGSGREVFSAGPPSGRLVGQK